MPVEKVRRSSLSNEVIPDGTGARLRLMFNDPSRVDMKADLTDAEAEDLAMKCGAASVNPRPGRRTARGFRL